MRKVLVVGTKETHRLSLVESAIKGIMNGGNIGHINLNKLSAIKNYAGNGSLQDIYISLYDELDRKLQAMDSNGASTVVIESYYTLDTHSGFVPLLTDRFFKLFKPESIVLLENPEDSLKNHKESTLLKDQQKVNREHGVRHSSTFGTSLKIVPVNPVHQAVSVRDIQDAIRNQPTKQLNSSLVKAAIERQ